MNFKELTIEGYKSIGKITISNPNPFTVFVGPNASGKSNIFEALEFLELCTIMNEVEASKLFGGVSDIINQTGETTKNISIGVDLGELQPFISLISVDKYILSTYEKEGLFSVTNPDQRKQYKSHNDFISFTNFTRLFVGQPSRLRRIDDSRISTNGYKESNLEKVLKRILKDENKKEEIFEILRLLIPGFEKVEIVSSELSGRDDMVIYETGLKKPLTKEFISDGTFNIISIIASLFQSDEPQFLCIEEPENGLNPFVVKELADIIRDICEEKGHYVWLNTHSQSLVSVLTTEEIVIVEKVKGLTQIKQIQGMNLYGLRMDEALYTNSIGGGNPW